MRRGFSPVASRGKCILLTIPFSSSVENRMYFNNRMYKNHYRLIKGATAI
nr:MAG TPA: hypothetical protein [Caudoviricetes sp.]